MNKNVNFILLFFWFAAILTPSVFTFLDFDKNIVVNVIDEEEQKEQEKKDPTEEKIVQDNFADFTLIANSDKFKKGDFRTTIYSDYTSEIHLPPPEDLS